MKIGICIPYRDRKEHLDQLVPHLSKHLDENGIEYTFYVGHQVDDKLFNRGAMKNIAAHYAFQDGCDYIAWHDVDMLPFEEADYSYPTDTPIHIATQLSKYNYGMGYDQYFGGVVLFNKEQVEKTNGYSNEYWDWGQEDDDLFWRCYFEKMTTGNILTHLKDKIVANFNGDNSLFAIPTNREISSCLHNDHTITLMFNAEQQDHKTPIWLVGDTERKFVEYPLVRKVGSRTWGLSFNNSRAATVQVYDRHGELYYNWGKRFEGLWTQVTFSYSKENKEGYFFINNELISQVNDIRENIPFLIESPLKSHDSIKPFVLGYCPHLDTYFKGKICDFRIYNKTFTSIKEMNLNSENLLLTNDIGFNIGVNENVNFTAEDIQIIENVVPYRRESKFECLPHTDEGFVDGKWAKGETTAKNERRFVTEMQQGKINYKSDGINNILTKLKVESINTEAYSKTKIINCNMI